MKYTNSLYAFAFYFLFTGLRNYPACSQVPSKEQSKSILLINGTAHLGNGKIIENSALGLDKGKLILVEDFNAFQLTSVKFDTVINVSGKQIYPGLISVNSTLGLTEIDAVRATRDFNDVGEINPNIRSLTAFNAESSIIPTVRSNGVLLAQITPRGGLISGTSTIMELDAWNWEDAVYKMDDGIHLNWPEKIKEKESDEDSSQPKKIDKNNEQIFLLKEFFSNAKAYSVELNPKEKNLRFEAMRDIFTGKKTLFVHADLVKEIMQAINFGKEFEVKKLVIVGGYDAWLIPDFLKENNIPVMVRRVHELPIRNDEDLDLPYKIPFLLQKAGILFCLDNSGDMEAMNTRNLPFYAGTAAGYGLTKEQALMSVTLNTAKILGIEKTTGSLEAGKDATLFISTGDALDMKTNNVEIAFIRGKIIDLENHQKFLYRKYSEKDGN